MDVPQNIKTRTTYDAAIPLLGIYLKKTKPLNQKEICIPKFNAALFTTAKVCKQPTCPLTDEWIKKV